jgi:ketosteroid isomerase-like protein
MTTRRLRCALLLAAGGLLAAAGAAAQRPADAAGRRASRTMDSLYAVFTRAYETLTPGLVSNLYAEDAFYLSPGDTIQRGRAYIHGSFARFFDSVRARGDSISIAFEIVDRRVSGGLGTDVGYYNLRSWPKGEAPRTSRGKFVVIWQRRADGTWRIQADGYSGVEFGSTPPPRRPAP